MKTVATHLANDILAKLTLEEKVELLTGFDFWNTVANERIGLRQMLLSDGPAGVRGEFWDERDNSLNLTSGTALGSAWSVDFAKEYGRHLALEAYRKGVDVVLGPTINLHRSPLGGRHFECLSEDPMLTGAIAAAFTSSIQALGKGACPKHYVANDFETDRYNVDVRVDERTLNEVYLRPFEDAVKSGGAWTIMSSYNSVNGSTLTENDLLQDPLRSRWDFDGVVISDWTAVRSIDSAKYEQDLVMPGPVGPWGEALVEAVRSGEVDEEAVDRKVLRLLLLAHRVGALSANGEMPTAPVRHNEISHESVAFARRAAIEGSVLLQNDGILPLVAEDIKSVALIGHNAKAARTQGGGSATVLPKKVVTPLDALNETFAGRLSYSVGAIVQAGIAEIPLELLTNSVTGEAGVQVEFLDAERRVIYSEQRLSTRLTWLGSNAPLPTACFIRIRTQLASVDGGAQLFGYATPQPVKVLINKSEFLNEKIEFESDDPFLALMDPPFVSKLLSMEQGSVVDIDIEIDLAGRTGLAVGAQSFVFGFETDPKKGDEYIREAALSARDSELAIVVVGTNSQVESEGFDRKDLRLPGRQDELVEAVLGANPNTIVIVNSGSPVVMPWRNKARAILLTYFGGQEMGNALVDMLTGVAEPGGRLPTTWAAQESDLPVSNCTPEQPGNHVTYDEGIHIGYRAWLKSGVAPAYEFGHGLGYTTWQIESVSAPQSVSKEGAFTLDAVIRNTGLRRGKHVVQVYISKLNSSIDRPVRWLAGFAEVHAEAGESKTVSVEISNREFAHWNQGWNHELGAYTLQVGSSVSNIAAEKVVVLS